MAQTLYILATPIGNVQEANSLLIDKLETLPILFCEDTRVTDKLLNLLAIKNKPKLISYHKFNEKEKNQDYIKYLEKNDCGLISDAGYPAISDPGHVIISACHEQGINVRVVNGSCAVNHAIAQSGFASEGYTFIGFLPRVNKQIVDTLNYHLEKGLPVVCFESVHRVNETIEVLKQAMPDNIIYIGRELTKKFEEYKIDQIKNIKPFTEKGEFVLIIKPNQFVLDNSKQGISNEMLQHLSELVKLNVKLKDACKIIASIYKVDAKVLYNIYVKGQVL